MFKNHPKGLLGAALSNMGERFGFYIMMAILLLFLEFKFDFVGTPYGGLIYSVFYALIYVLALVGGLIADRTKNYKSTITIGIVLMMIGYAVIAWPTPTPAPNKTITLIITCLGLFAIAFGNGLFKGNLQAVVGQLYDNPEYSDKRDTGFQIFYMFINVGAMFAPLLAVGLRNWVVSSQGYAFNEDLPALCNEYLSNGAAMTQEAMARFTLLASEVGNKLPNLADFAKDYLNVFVTGYHYSFAIAILAMLISFVIFMTNKNKLPNPADKSINRSQAAEIVEMSAAEIKQRIYALFAVFGVVIFFWFSFHQNGVTLTKFANDYTRLDGMVLDLGFTVLKGAELFQSFNPFFVVCLTPIVIGLFGWLKARGKEPSTPKKIGIGMGIAAIAFVVMALGSYGLPSTQERIAEGGLNPALRVTPWLLIGTYFILTVAELFISPLGLSFVSKVAPPQYQGIMQGAWLSATAVGNQLLFIGTILYNNIPIWATWTVFVVACLLSMGTMLAMVKWLERVTK
ncbi:MAG: peptide MFS transporter [Bacteroidales bacterium]|jgi:POT family proton-dependent oligopeptide transporter|nr:peptide MFS transporter [Bacteroidales bacterium]